MANSYKKLGHRLILTYIISICFFGLIYYIYNNILIFIVSSALTGIIIFFFGRYLMKKFEKDESLSFLTSITMTLSWLARR